MRYIISWIVLLLVALPASANTVVEVVGRVVDNNLANGPWSGARPAEYVVMTYTVTGTGTTTSACGAGSRRFTLVPGSFHVTLHGSTMDAPLFLGGGGYNSPTCLFADNCPVADVIMFESGATLANPGTSTAVYNMVCELHNSTGLLWNNVDISQDLGYYGHNSFDYVEWNIGSPFTQTSLTLQFVSLNIRSTEDATGSCCLGDGFCAVTSGIVCTSGAWTAGAPCTASTCPASGACCLGNGQCALLTQADCLSNSNAIYSGDGSSCTNTTCPTPSACCIGGACSLLTQQACLNSGGTWQAPQPGWLGTTAACDLQPQYTHSFRANVPDATGGTTQQPVITPGVYTDSISVTDPTPIQRVELWLGIGLQRVNDVHVQLTGPNGTTLDLIQRIGSTPPDCTVTPVGAGYQLFDTVILQDDAPQSIYDHVLSQPVGSLVTGGRLRPAACGGTPVSLTAPTPAGFGGLAAQGIWTIHVIDERPGISIYLNAWGLSFNQGSTPACSGPTCGSADFNCDGDTATDADIEAFFACLAGNCPAAPCNATADFNGDGDVATDADIEAFFRVLAGGTC